ncbi:unnamed protein product [Cuscuta campestris]|uniref:Uncharacterized protein n=1 Tax=Cuscuta campestris TaxID=132261 RepID=A0A484LVY6_9ASTE|nr:unnamed protein product [Cuscuta campestris]
MLHCSAESSRFPPDAASPETLQPPGSGVQEILGLAFLCETKPKKLNSPLHLEDGQMFKSQMAGKLGEGETIPSWIINVETGQQEMLWVEEELNYGKEKWNGYVRLKKKGIGYLVMMKEKNQEEKDLRKEAQRVVPLSMFFVVDIVLIDKIQYDLMTSWSYGVSKGFRGWVTESEVEVRIDSHSVPKIDKFGSTSTPLCSVYRNPLASPYMDLCTLIVSKSPQSNFSQLILHRYRFHRTLNNLILNLIHPCMTTHPPRHSHFCHLKMANMSFLHNSAFCCV